MFQTIVRVSKFTAGEKKGLDKNGKQAVYLNYVSGASLPQRARVISGTVAEQNGFVVGETYICNWQETWEDEQYGMQYVHTVVSKVGGADLLGLFASRLSEVQNLQFVRKQAKEPAEPKETVTTAVTQTSTVGGGEGGE